MHAGVLFSAVSGSIGGIDATVLLLYLAAVIAFSLLLSGRQKDLSSYLVGGRDMPWWALMGSIVATETSTATFLSVPGIAYAQGGDMRFLQLAIGYVVGRIAIVYILLPLYFRGELFTAYQVLDERFGGAVKRLASLIFLVTRNLGDGLRLFLTAIVLEEVAGVPLPWCIALIGLATVIYTVIGGIKSVVWNDCIQMVVYMVGGAVVGWVIVDSLPGHVGQVVEYAQQNQKLRLFDWSWGLSEAYTVWAGVIGGAVLSLGTHGTDQMMVQRYLCARSFRDAAKALIGSGFLVLLQFAFFLLLGIALAAFYAENPLEETVANDRVLARFVVRELPVNIGLIGFILAAVFSAAMSTLSSSLNSSASAVVNDFLLTQQTEKGAESDQTRLLSMTRWLTIGFGVVQVIIGIGASYVSKSVVGEALAIAGFSAGLLLGVFLLGVAAKHVQSQHALCGLGLGLLTLLIVRFGLPHVGIAVAWPWYALIGSTVTFVGGIVASSKQGSAASE